MTVGEVKTHVDSHEYGGERLQEIYEYETDNADRVTLKRWLKRQGSFFTEEDDEHPVPEVVTVTAPYTGYHGPVWIDAPYEVVEVEKTQRLIEELKDGDLELVPNPRS